MFSKISFQFQHTSILKVDQMLISMETNELIEIRVQYLLQNIFNVSIHNIPKLSRSRARTLILFVLNVTQVTIEHVAMLNSKDLSFFS